ncbi:MAG: zinc-ribbon domain-containing protein [Candidatus Bathyarchaeia archaeon]|nr:zinc-ribbon domain-containing protein [Candidatus Bathyarchaeota archaeon]
MATCSKCGFKLPEGAAFCPNCGAPVERVREEAAPSESIAGLLRLSIMGAFLALAILLFAGSVNLYFLPYFFSALIVIYFSKVNRLKDAVIVATAIYLFGDAFLTGLFLGEVYISNQPLAAYYGDYAPTIIDVLMYSISPIMAIVAGYIGFKISPRRREEESYPKGFRFEPTSTYFTRSLAFLLKKLKYSFLGSR